MSTFTSDDAIDNGVDPLAPEQDTSGDRSLSGGLPALGGSVSSPASNHSGILIVALVLVVAGAALFFMRKLGLGGNFKWTTVKIDYPVGAEQQLNDRHVRVMEDLQGSDEVVQVALKDLQRNPFVLNDKKEDPIDLDIPDNISPEELARRQLERTRKEERMKFSALELNAILGGMQPIARVSGRAYRVGDIIVDTFIVREIHGRSVVLEADAGMYTLEMGQKK